MNDLLQRLREMWKGMSGNQRMTLAAITALVFVALATATMTLGQPSWVPLLPPGQANSEVASQVQDSLKARNVQFQVHDDGNIYVLREEKARIGLDLLGEGILPEGTKLMDWIFDADFTATNQVRDLRMKVSTERLLQNMIARIEAVQRAGVMITVEPDTGLVLGSRRPSKATVQIVLKPGKELTPVNVIGIARMISGAVKDLEPQNVEISDQRGQFYPVPDKKDSYQKILSQMQAEAESAKALTENILNVLAYIRNKRVTVRAKLNFKETTLTSVKYDVENVVPVKTHKVDESKKGGTTSGTPNVAPVQTEGLNRTPIALGGAAAGATNEEEKKSESEIENAASFTKIDTQEPVGGITDASVAVVIDKKEVEEKKLDLEDIRKIVSTSAGIQAAGIHITTMPIPEAPVPAEAGAWERARELFDAYGEKLLLWILILGGLWVLWRTIQRSLPTQITEEIARIRAEFVKAPEVRPEVVIADAAEERILKIKGNVRDLVQKSPKTVAGILKRWMKT